MFQSILVPIDVAHRSSWQFALPQAIEMARSSGGIVTVMTVIGEMATTFEGVYLHFQLE
jgi:hypothetical protein